jgi:DNA-directed RNA polymerase specialized sigma24 family protein
MTDRRARFEALALPHLDSAYSLARWLSRSPTDAEDIVQDAMLRAFRAFDGARVDHRPQRRSRRNPGRRRARPRSPGGLD